MRDLTVVREHLADATGHPTVRFEGHELVELHGSPGWCTEHQAWCGVVLDRRAKRAERRQTLAEERDTLVLEVLDLRKEVDALKARLAQS